ncbi:MAG: MBL fold metallo-hydrolase [Deltaproteobacteria bacterium]|nr:MBL fold metallo-hydrolase [Deltaproteobacteria bacterium]
MSSTTEAQARPTEVASNVAWFPARTPTLPPATDTNSFALGDGPVVLVEPATPYEDEQTAWLAWARSLAAARTIEAIVVTHHHPDHVGGAGAFATALGVPLWAHPATAERLDAPVVRRLDEGDVLALGTQRWEVLHTPGHAPGHICLIEPQLGVGVVGDMVASVGTIVIDPVEGDVGRYLVELERLAARDLTLALPAHGAPIAAPTGLFRHYVAHRRAREAKIFAAVTTLGHAALDGLLPLAYDDVPRALWPLARLSLEAHLRELARQGRVVEAASEWRTCP